MSFIDSLRLDPKLYAQVAAGRHLDKIQRGELAQLLAAHGISEAGTVGTQGALAECLGCTRQTIARWKKEGMPIEPDGSYNVITVLEWRSDDLFAQEAPAAPGSEKGHWEVQYRMYKAKLAELDFLKERGGLLPRAEVEGLLVSRAIEFKRSLLTWGRRLSLQLAGKTAEQCFAVIEGEVITLLEIYSRPSPIIEQAAKNLTASNDAAGSGRDAQGPEDGAQGFGGDGAEKDAPVHRGDAQGTIQEERDGD